jgi:uncharacterized protein
MTAAFHDGEVAAQRKAGTAGTAAMLSVGIGDTIAAHSSASTLLSSLPLLAITSVSPNKAVWISPALGAPGFAGVQQSNAITLGTAAAAAVHPTDPLAAALARPCTLLGLVAVDFAARRRYRANGVASRTTDGGALPALAVHEFFPNCPKYIQRRTAQLRTGGVPLRVDAAVEERPALSEGDAAIVRAADTVFLGTVYDQAGADANHRGGRPGFVRVISPTSLAWPDYRGNGMFQSAGNLERNSRAAMLFVDFATGDFLQLSGSAVVDWDAAGEYDGAARVMRFEVRQVRRTRALTDYRWHLEDPSPYNPVLSQGGGGAPAADGDSLDTAIPLVLAKIVDESPTVKTFRFLAPRRVRFLPGQYATFRFDGVLAVAEAGAGAPAVRTWTLSETSNSTHGDDSLEVSVKRKPGGFVSTWLHAHAAVGLCVSLLGIDGDMTAVREVSSGAGQPFLYAAPRKLLLVSGGIGMTPNLAILRGLDVFLNTDDAAATDVFLVHSERRAADLPFQRELVRRADSASGPRLRIVNVLSGPGESVVEQGGSVTTRLGRVTVSLLAEEVGDDIVERECYVCGPPGFLQGVSAALVTALGVDPKRVHHETFDF